MMTEQPKLLPVTQEDRDAVTDGMIDAAMDWRERSRVDLVALSGEVERLREALEPFERLARAVEARNALDGLGGLAAGSYVHRLTTEDYRRAIQALSPPSQEEQS